MSKKDIVIDAFKLANLSKLVYVPGVSIAVAGAIGRRSLPSVTYQVPNGLEQDRVLHTSDIGTPVFIDLQIDSPAYINDAGVSYAAQTLQIDAVLVQVAMTKNIVKTTLQGKSGTVKEYISDGDWSVNIKGVELGTNGTYPAANVIKLRTIARCPYPVVVTGWYLNQIFDIHNLVIESLSFPQEEGKYSAAMFEFACISDEPVELKLNA
jgi:hypothetical protein